MTSDRLQEELGAMLGRCVNVIRELETENAALKARREWQSLTDQEIWESANRGVVGGIGRPSKAVAIARAIEAALREKNGG